MSLVPLSDARRLARTSAPFLLVFLALATLFAAGQQPTRVNEPRRVATGSVPPPRFASADRPTQLATAFPEIARLFDLFVDRLHMPGATMGIIVDGELVWTRTRGVRQVGPGGAANAAAPAPAAGTEVTPDTVFRIASMTKSFTALAILKLRDEGRLSLDDPVARYIPELAGLAYPSSPSGISSPTRRGFPRTTRGAIGSSRRRTRR